MSFAKKGSKKGAGRKRLQLENEEVKKLNELCALLPKSTSLGSIITPTTTTTTTTTTSSSSSSGDEDSTSSAPLSNFTTFAQLPLSAKTQGGLKSAGYTTLTEIQRVALPDGLAGRDVLGAAKTGSGKTLAFLIPVIERLYRARWTIHDGIGAIIISPTRELAYQIFEVLRKVGARHEISAGLAIGGKAVDEEKERISRMNILVCTPGRLLQHMDETPNFNCDNLQILVLDEADRILDLGFSKALDAILDFLPKSRQTLLFSATQTKSVRDLARLSLNSPEYAAVHEHAKHSTPQKLTQYYVVCTLPKKLDILYSFIRTHLSMKILVFMSSCKQVRFVFEAFRRLRPGIPLMALYGKQKQMKRMAIYNDFAKKSAAVMFATDIAARGLDFPSVHWVIQLDCPEDCATYIHRVGRTARFEKAGNALLLLLPSEKEGMISELEEHKVPLQNIEINPEKNTSIVKSLQSFCTQEPEIKYLAQKSFVSYMRSVFLQSNKKIFDVNALPAEEYALSLGLPGQPKIRFAKKSEKLHGPAIPENGKNKATEDEDDDDDDDESESENENENENEKEDEDDAPTSTSSKKVKTAIDRIRSRKNQDVLSDAWKKLREVEEEEEEDDVLVVRRKNHDLNELVAGSDDDDDDDAPEETSARDSNTPSNGIEHTASRAQKEKPLSKAKLAKKLANSNIKINTKVMFDDDGNTVDEAGNIVDVTAVKDLEEIESREPTVLTIEESKAKMKEADRLDLIAERRRVKEKHREKARKLKQRRKEENDEYGGLGVTLAPMGEDEFGNEDDEDDEDDEDEDDDNEYNHEDDDDNGSKSFRGKRGYDSESEEDDEDDDEDEDEDEDEDHRFSAKKGQQKSKHTSKKARSNGNDLEQLALSLLK